MLLTMKKTMMYLPDDMHGYLARESAERGVSMAEIAREAIAQYRARRAEERPPDVSSLVGVIDDDVARDDLALTIDETLADHYAQGGTWEQEHGLADPR
jgi:hypothetical protein